MRFLFFTPLQPWGKTQNSHGLQKIVKKPFARVARGASFWVPWGLRPNLIKDHQGPKKLSTQRPVSEGMKTVDLFPRCQLVKEQRVQKDPRFPSRSFFSNCWSLIGPWPTAIKE